MEKTDGKNSSVEREHGDSFKLLLHRPSEKRENVAHLKEDKSSDPVLARRNTIVRRKGGRTLEGRKENSGHSVYLYHVGIQRRMQRVKSNSRERGGVGMKDGERG